MWKLRPGSMSTVGNEGSVAAEPLKNLLLSQVPRITVRPTEMLYINSHAQVGNEGLVDSFQSILAV